MVEITFLSHGDFVRTRRGVAIVLRKEVQNGVAVVRFDDGAIRTILDTDILGVTTNMNIAERWRVS